MSSKNSMDNVRLDEALYGLSNLRKWDNLPSSFTTSESEWLVVGSGASVTVEIISAVVEWALWFSATDRPHTLSTWAEETKKGVKVDTAIVDYPTRNNKINKIYYYVPRPNNQLFCFLDTFCEILCVSRVSSMCFGKLWMRFYKVWFTSLSKCQAIVVLWTVSSIRWWISSNAYSFTVAFLPNAVSTWFFFYFK